MRCRLLLLLQTWVAAVPLEYTMSAETRSARPLAPGFSTITSETLGRATIGRDVSGAARSGSSSANSRPRETAFQRGIGFRPEATCCQPPVSTVVRNGQPLARWVLAESGIGEITPAATASDAMPKATAEPERSADATTPRTATRAGDSFGAQAPSPAIPPAPAVESDVAPDTNPSATGAALARTLSRWSAASQALEPLCPARSRRLTRAFREERRGHEIALLGWFQGPVEVDALTQRFEWTVVSKPADPVVLSGVPRDATERLFVERFELTLDDGGLPSEIRFFERSGAPRGETVALSERRMQCEASPRASALVGSPTRAVRRIAARPVFVQTAELTNDADDDAGHRADGGVRLVGASLEETDVERILADWARAVAADHPQPRWFGASIRDRVEGTVRKQLFRASWEPNGAVKIETPLSSGARSLWRRDESKNANDDRVTARSTNGDDAPRPVANDVLFSLLAAARPEELTTRFRIEAEADGDTERRLWLRPRGVQERLGQVELILSADSGRPISARAVDRSGRYETVWTVLRSEPRDATK